MKISSTHRIVDDRTHTKDVFFFYFHPDMVFFSSSQYIIASSTPVELHINNSFEICPIICLYKNVSYKAIRVKRRERHAVECE